LAFGTHTQRDIIIIIIILMILHCQDVIVVIIASDIIFQLSKVTTILLY
jgi:hypothetical protein